MTVLLGFACSCKPYLLRLCCFFLAWPLGLAGLPGLMFLLQLAAGVLEVDGSAASAASLATAAAVEAASLAAACTSLLLSVSYIVIHNQGKLSKSHAGAGPCCKMFLRLASASTELQTWCLISISVALYTLYCPHSEVMD